LFKWFTIFVEVCDTVPWVLVLHDDMSIIIGWVNGKILDKRSKMWGILYKYVLSIFYMISRGCY